MMCPLRFGIAGGGCNCIGPMCVWWSRKYLECVMVILAESNVKGDKSNET